MYPDSCLKLGAEALKDLKLLVVAMLIYSAKSCTEKKGDQLSALGPFSALGRVEPRGLNQCRATSAPGLPEGLRHCGNRSALRDPPVPRPLWPYAHACRTYSGN